MTERMEVALHEPVAHPRSQRFEEASYLPKYARLSRRDCEDESRGVSSACTTSSASFL